MIIIKIWGGIGNQLFQYVFGQYLHHKYNIEVRYDNNSFISTDTLRNSELAALKTPVRLDNRCVFSRYRGIKNRVLRYSFQLCPKYHFINELDGKSLPSCFKDKHLYFFQGYWQDHHYYDWLKKHVPQFEVDLAEWPKELQTYKEPIATCNNSVSIHIRRGDYFTPKNIGNYGVCDVQYFTSAIGYMKEKVGKCSFFVFSDDIQWVKNNIALPENSVIIENYNVPQFAYIYLMSLCKHHIISNSSFSWWGAVLNEQPDAVVIAPKHWTLNSDKTIALDKWQKL